MNLEETALKVINFILNEVKKDPDNGIISLLVERIAKRIGASEDDVKEVLATLEREQCILFKDVFPDSMNRTFHIEGKPPQKVYGDYYFISVNPKKMSEACKELEGSIGKEVGRVEYAFSYSNRTLLLEPAGGSIDFTRSRLMHELLKVAMTLPVGIKIDMLTEGIYFKDWRQLYDAASAINRKVRSELEVNQDFFVIDWNSKTVSRQLERVS